MDTIKKLQNENINITDRIIDKLDNKLYLQENHPLHILSHKIKNYFDDFEYFDNLSPIVSIYDNFDSLLIPKDHPSRNKSDTYYINDETILRCHTSAHQVQLLKKEHEKFIIIGDVYRKDEINATHYPIFHQVEGIKLFPKDTNLDIVIADLKNTLLELMKSILNNNDIEYKWSDDYFPFTSPSFELEIKYNNEWIEVLGCWIIKEQILKNGNVIDKIGWAFGLGLERIAMKMFEIPDIRYFWSKDKRFIEQFNKKDYDSITPTKFKPYGNHPDRIMAISFWINDEHKFNDNDFFEIIRDICGNNVEKVEIIDEFRHPKNNNLSKCFQINLRHPDKEITKHMTNEYNDLLNNYIDKCSYLKSRSK